MKLALDGGLATAPVTGCAARRKQSYYAAVAAHRTFTSRLSAARPFPVTRTA
jgi:hypothetical protein